ncbi:MAG: flagellar basal body-associated FliL family protein [Proteobacteria bacterium]|nr:flagellar basal body-associated FliL family protein [Pseudomonadota bacterium]
MARKFLLFALTVFLLSIINTACNRAPEIDLLLIGSWRIKRANIHAIHSFRQNKSWVEQERVEGKFSRIVETKEKVEGNWAVEHSKADGKMFLIITPSTIRDGKGPWVKDQAFRFEVLDINKDKMILKQENDQVTTWTRVRSKQTEDGEIDLSIALVNPGPIVVNLQMDRNHEKFRFLCLDMELSVEDAEGLDYLSPEKNPDTEVITYHLHPIIRDMAISFFSAQTYKDTKSLDKVKDVVNQFKIVLNPYFEGRLTDVKVNKVVVTANKESVLEFEKLYAEQYGLTVPGDTAPAPVNDTAQ